VKKFTLCFILASFLFGCPARTVIIEEPLRSGPPKEEKPAYNKTPKAEDLSDYEFIAKIEEERKKGWIFYSESSNGIYCIHVSSIDYLDTTIRAWIKRISKKKDYSVQETKTLYEVSCQERTYRILSSVSYDKNGEVLRSSDISESKWRHITPDSVMEALFDILCHK
jgi:hypothetical protein